jgi:hypothetical protein
MGASALSHCGRRGIIAIVGSRCGAEHEYAFSCGPLATFIQSTLEKKKHEYPK